MLSVGRDATYTLTEEEFRYVREGNIGVVREKVIARNVVPVNNIGSFGKSFYKYYKDVDMGAAWVGIDGSEKNADIAGVSTSNLDIPTIHKDFQIPYRDLVASQTAGEPLDARTSRMAAEKVAEKEEGTVWEGTTAGTNAAVTVTGLGAISGAGQDAGGGGDYWSGTVATDVYQSKKDLLLAIHALRTDKYYGPYYAVLTKNAEIALWQTVPDTGGALLREFWEKLCSLGVYGTDHLYASVASTTNRLIVGEPGQREWSVYL